MVASSLDLPKNPQIRLSFHMCKSSVSSQIAADLRSLFLDWGNSRNCYIDSATRVKSKLETDRTHRDSLDPVSSSKLVAVVADVSGAMTPSHSTFSCLHFAVCVFVS